MFANFANNRPTADSSIITATGSAGTLFTAGSPADTKGSYAQIIASTTADAFGFWISFFATSTSGAVRNILVDIAIGGAGSEVIIVPNMMVHGAGGWAASPHHHFIPIFIPKGSRLSIRSQCTTASHAAACWVRLRSGLRNPPEWVGVGAEPLGINATNNGGTQLTLGNSDTNSSWTNLNAGTTSRNIKRLIPCVGTDSVITAYNALIYIYEVGFSSTLLDSFYLQTNTAEAVSTEACPVIECDIPAGTQLQVRGRCSGTAQRLQFMLMGIF